MVDFLKFTLNKFIFRVDTTCFYSPEGLWVKIVDNQVRLGLSDFLQQRSGDIAFADVKPEGTVMAVGDEVCAIETIKVNISLSSPISGFVVCVNPLIEAAPETINQDPFGDGWLCEIDAANWDNDCKNLLEPAAYFAQMKREVENEDKSNE